MTVQQFRASFGDEQQCGEQLSRQRWPDGFKCPRCGGSSRGYMAERQVHECTLCAYQCSVIAGTIFHKTRTPLSSWFWAIYRMSHDKKGISALQLAKEIGVSYPCLLYTSSAARTVSTSVLIPASLVNVSRVCMATVYSQQRHSWVRFACPALPRPVD